MKLNISKINRIFEVYKAKEIADASGVNIQTVYKLKNKSYNLDNIQVDTLLKLQSIDNSKDLSNDEIIDLDQITAFFDENTTYQISKKSGLRPYAIERLREKGVGIAKLKNIRKLFHQEHIVIDAQKIEELFNSKCSSDDIAAKCNLDVHFLDKLRRTNVDDLTIKTAKILMQYFD